MSEFTHDSIDLAKEMQAKRPVSAWLMSLVMHCSVVVLLGVSWKMIPKNAAIEPDREVGIVLVHQQQGHREYTNPHADDSANDVSATSQATQNAMPSQNEIPVDLSEVIPGAASVTAGGMAASILDATQLTGEGAKRAGGETNGTSTEVFGITGVGTKFVYVFDRSGSMANNKGRPLRAAKMELIESLGDLDSVHQFQIIFYNQYPQMFEPPSAQSNQLVWGNEEGKQLAGDFVKGVKAQGGTKHMPALLKALNMNPDVVFFLTDADEPRLTYNNLREIRRKNNGTTIHAIEFGPGPRRLGENFLTKLAEQNGGQHAYVDILLLRDGK